MIDLLEICNRGLNKGLGIAILPCQGIFSEDGYFTQDSVTFAQKDSIVGLDIILESINSHEIKNNEDIEANLKLMDGGTIQEVITSLTGVSKDIFIESDLAILYFDSDIVNMEWSHKSDMALLKSLSDTVFNALNIIRFIHCDLFFPDRLPNIPGYWESSGGYMGAVLINNKGVGFLAGRQVSVGLSYGLGLGLDMDDILRMEHKVDSMNKKESDGEVGGMISHGLNLYSRAMYINNETFKFITSIALFEYLATGNKYTNFKKVRAKIQAHIATDMDEYNRLTDRFMSFTSKIKNGKNIGYRTRIIHEGAFLDELIPLENDRTNLFKELSGYVYKSIRGMNVYRTETLEELQKHRYDLYKNLTKT